MRLITRNVKRAAVITGAAAAIALGLATTAAAVTITPDGMFPSNAACQQAGNEHLAGWRATHPGDTYTHYVCVGSGKQWQLDRISQ
jgi:hypothetical protein